MATNSRRSLLAAGALVALAGLALPAAAAETGGTKASQDAPLVLAQASPQTAANRVAARDGVYPAYQRGVREAARQGPEALRRYIWRTRMIYNFYYPDFVEG